MLRINIAIASLGILGLMSCSPVKVPITNQYVLSAFSSKKDSAKPHSATLKISNPEAAVEYQTSQMLYVKKPYRIESFANNAWASPPASMLYPLIVQSFQESGYFHAISSSVYAETSDYRLDTQLLRLQQNFLTVPSVLEFSVKVVLTHNEPNQVIGSHIFTIRVPCPEDTPYGGVLAANVAVKQFTAKVTRYVIAKVAKKSEP